MERKRLEIFFKKKQKIKLNLINGRFFTGIIIDLDDDSLVFKDKFDNELTFSLDSISYIDIVNYNGGARDG